MIEFRPPRPHEETSHHHESAAAGNADATSQAIDEMFNVIEQRSQNERILLRAAAGAGKSFALKRMVSEAINSPSCSRVGIAAFANKQLFPLAEDLGTELGKDAVCLWVSSGKFDAVSDSTKAAATVVTSRRDVPDNAKVIISTSHMVRFQGSELLTQMGQAKLGHLYDVLFVDEAWQLPLHLYSRIEQSAPLTVGVGDVGQLPPLDSSQNPWRGDGTYNPYRAWPTVFEDDDKTWSIELPAVWRPTGEQLPLWRSFYREWKDLNCVAAPGDRSLVLGEMDAEANAIWQQVATGIPTLVEIDGLASPEAADIDPPLLQKVEEWLDQLLAAGVNIRSLRYDSNGKPDGETSRSLHNESEDTVIALLATRNQAVDDAHGVAERLSEKYDLPEGALVASTVDSWQGQTNALTVAIHPLSGASQLSEFNSAFGRLAVTCTRATHGLLLVSRAGIDELLESAAARPGTPLGEPGIRQLPRQTHERILETFARATTDCS